MGKNAVIKWNASQLQSIKRDLLLFETFYYDPYLLHLQTKLIENVARLMKSDAKIIDEINANVEFLRSASILQEFELNDFKKGKVKIDIATKDTINKIIKEVDSYDIVHKSFIAKYNETVKLLRSDYRKGFLEFINLLNDFSIFADHHIRLTCVILQSSKSNKSIFPIVENYDNLEHGKEFEVLRLIINN